MNSIMNTHYESLAAHNELHSDTLQNAQHEINLVAGSVCIQFLYFSSFKIMDSKPSQASIVLLLYLFFLSFKPVDESKCLLMARMLYFTHNISLKCCSSSFNC